MIGLHLATICCATYANKSTSEAGSFNKSSSLATALGLTKLIVIIGLHLDKLFCAA
jgi:hypothetical protein